MDVATHDIGAASSSCSWLHHAFSSCSSWFRHAYSSKRWCLLASIALVFSALLLIAALSITVPIMRPRKKPVFSLKTSSFESYKLDQSSMSISSVVSLTLNAGNHNKVGMGFRPSTLAIHHNGSPVGEMDVPRFYLPPHSHDVPVENRVLLSSLNATQIASEISRRSLIQFRIFGHVKAYVRVFHINLPKFKVCTYCHERSKAMHACFFLGFIYSEIFLLKWLLDWNIMLLLGQCASCIGLRVCLKNRY